MWKNNKGYSLVELIIVIAIMALLTGTAFFSISMIFSAGANACANSMKEALAENKVIAMGKSEAKLEIYRGDDECVYVIQWMKQKKSDAWIPKETDEEGNAVPEKIGNSRVAVTYRAKDGSMGLLKNAGDSIELCYDRGSGSFSDKSEGCILCETIWVKGGSRSYKLTLVELTGKVTVELE